MIFGYFSLCTDFSTDMEHTISERLLANPNRACIHLPHEFRGSYEYLIDYQSEDSCVH